MAKLLPLIQRTTFGKAKRYSSGSGYNLGGKAFELLSDPGSDGPTTFLVTGEVDLRARQGDSDVEVTSLDPIIYKKTYYQITVTSTENNWIALRSKDGTVPTNTAVQFFEIGALRPGDGASSTTYAVLM